jgi:allophanate hydrolase subunit 2
VSTPVLRLLSGPWVSIQDAGRPGHARHGAGPAGPMDQLTHLLAVRLAGATGAAGATMPTIEVGPGGARLRAEVGPVDLAVAGPGAVVRIDGEAVQAPAVVRLLPGVELLVAGTARWVVLCPVGRLDVSPVLGSVSRHGRSGLGPTWRPGDAIAVQPRVGDRAVPLGTRPAPPVSRGPLLLLEAPQTHLFPAGELARLVGATLVVSATGDRMAQRLDGVRLRSPAGHDIVSDAVVAGAVQVQGDGAPWVLTAEHQPTGGYPKVAVLSAVDRCRLVQLPPGSEVRLRWGDVAEARARWSAAVAAVERTVAAPVRPTADRLRGAPVAGAVVDDDAASSGQG